MKLSATDGGGSGLACTAYRIDGGALTTYAGPFEVTGDGSHSISYHSTDRTGYVNIELKPPATKAAAATVKRGKTAALRFRVSDPLPSCDRATVKIEIKKGAKVVKRMIVGTEKTNAAPTYRYRAELGRDSYTYRALTTDIAGNKTRRTTPVKLTVR